MEKAANEPQMFALTAHERDAMLVEVRHVGWGFFDVTLLRLECQTSLIFASVRSFSSFRTAKVMIEGKTSACVRHILFSLKTAYLFTRKVSDRSCTSSFPRIASSSFPLACCGPLLVAFCICST